MEKYPPPQIKVFQDNVLMGLGQLDGTDLIHLFQAPLPNPFCPPSSSLPPYLQWLMAIDLLVALGKLSLPTGVPSNMLLGCQSTFYCKVLLYFCN